MKRIITLSIILIVLFGCSEKKEQTHRTINMDGFWSLASSNCNFSEEMQERNCLDPEDVYDPYALGSHFLIQSDSISFFRYPYQYYGTFKYKMLKDSLFIKTNLSIAHQFLIQKKKKNNLFLSFDEAITSSCLIKVTAQYELFTPDAKIINKLLKDSASYNSLIGKWWYLRKEIGYNDGGEPTILKYPKGMPDSLFVSNEIVNENVQHPFFELKLDNKMVKLFIEYPNEYSYRLRPYKEENKILFSRFIDYGDRQDTIYYDVIYQKYR